MTVVLRFPAADVDWINSALLKHAEEVESASGDLAARARSLAHRIGRMKTVGGQHFSPRDGLFLAEVMRADAERLEREAIAARDRHRSDDARRTFEWSARSRALAMQIEEDFDTGRAFDDCSPTVKIEARP